jgi:hypothetical protein
MVVVTWFSERLRDLFMWPLNLWRDFPARFGRLRQTWRQGAQALARAMPEMKAAAQNGRLLPWLRQAVGRLAGWLHLLLAHLFDLHGGPEIAQFFMRLPTRTTPLTPAEVAMMADLLGPAPMRYRDVRVAAGGIMKWVFKVNGNLAFATWHTIYLPEDGRHTRANLPVIVHELSHVYQYERVGSCYLGQAIYMLIKTRRDCYNYGGPDGLRAATAVGAHYRDFNREQQAKIVEDYFVRRRRGEDTSAYTPFITDLRAGRL